MDTENTTNQLEILIIDDNPMDVSLMEAIFFDNQPSYQLTEATTLAEGVEVILRKRIDLVLLDLNLPDASNCEGIHELKEKFPLLPIVVLSGTTDRSLVVEALKEGADDYLVKGKFTSERFHTVVRVAYERGKYLEKNFNLKSQLRIATDRLPMFLWTMNNEGVIKYVYGDTSKLIRLPRKALIGKKIGEVIRLINDSHVENTNIAFKKALEGHSSTLTLQHGLRWFNVFIEPLYEGASGKTVTGAVGLGTEVTREKLRSIELKQAKILAEQANEAKSKFLANVSHDIRTPINSLLGAGELLSDTSLNEEQNSLLNMIRSSGINLLSLVNDVLDLACIEAGKVRQKESSFSLRKIVSTCTDAINPLAKRKGLQVRLKFEGGADDEQLFGDEGCLRQILNNLIGNAVKYTQDGFVEVVARCRETGRGDVGVTIIVKDTGPGIPAEKRNLIFDEFEILETQGAQTGTGLGLAISKKLVSLLDGKIGVESKVGEGSSFWVEFIFKKSPAKVAVEVSEKYPAEESDADINGPTDELVNERISVLIVDDLEDNRFILGAFLKRFDDLDVQFAHGGLEAVEMAGKEDFDLIFMDMKMPDLDGFEATRRIRQAEEDAGCPNQSYIVALTASATTEYKEKCLMSGCDKFISKPVPRAELDKLVESIAVGRGRWNLSTGESLKITRV